MFLKLHLTLHAQPDLYYTIAWEQHVLLYFISPFLLIKRVCSYDASSYDVDTYYSYYVFTYDEDTHYLHYASMM